MRIQEIITIISGVKDIENQKQTTWSWPTDGKRDKKIIIYSLTWVRKVMRIQEIITIISGVKDMENQKQTTWSWSTHGKRDKKNNNLFTLISQKGDEDTGNNHWRWNFLIFKQLSLLRYLPYEQQKLPFGAFDPMNGYFLDVVDRCNHQMT